MQSVACHHHWSPRSSHCPIIPTIPIIPVLISHDGPYQSIISPAWCQCQVTVKQQLNTPHSAPLLLVCVYLHQDPAPDSVWTVYRSIDTDNQSPVELLNLDTCPENLHPLQTTNVMYTCDNPPKHCWEPTVINSPHPQEVMVPRIFSVVLILLRPLMDEFTL